MAKLYVGPPNVLEVQELDWGPLSPCRVWCGSDFSQKNVEFCLCVCPSCFWTTEFVRMILPWRHLNAETILIPLDRGRFVVVHPRSTFSVHCQFVAPQNCEVKNGEIWVFSLLEGNRINQLREILQISIAHGSNLAYQILPSLEKGAWYRSPQNVKIVVFLPWKVIQ